MSQDLTPWHSLPLGEVFARVGSKREGLSRAEAEKRLFALGANEIKYRKKTSDWMLFFRQFANPLVLVLLAAGAVTIFLGALLDAGVIFGVVFLNSAIGFWEERRALKTLYALQEKKRLFAWVRRDGEWRNRPIEELVSGDIVRLKPGDKVPADARLVSTSDLSVDEAILTGEFLSVEKSVSPIPPGAPLAERQNMVWRGTNVSDGKAEALVVATGEKTELGKIGQYLEDIEETRTPFEQKVRRLGRFLTVAIIFLTLALGSIGLLAGHSLQEMFLVAVAVVVSAIPEGLPVAVTVILAIGMTRILSKRGLLKRLSATEALGSTSVILTDKTGTLTTGIMKVSGIFTARRTRGLFELEPRGERDLVELVLEILVLTSEAILENPDDPPAERRIYGRPTDRAMLEAALAAGFSPKEEESRFELIKDIPFSSARKFSASVRKTPDGGVSIFFAGAPEMVLDYVNRVQLADRSYVMRPDEKTDIRNTISRLAREGLRLIAVGYRRLASRSEAETYRPARSLVDLLEGSTFVGLVVLKDPVREDVPETIKMTRQAGLRTVIVTGDHALTARAVAQEIGLLQKGRSTFSVMEGSEVDSLGVEELAHQVRSIDVFARVSPEHKVKIVAAWQKHGEVVAMSGDGVNDAPALKKADVGIAVGTGTDLAKDVADLVLLDNNFSTVVAAVREGRVILDNLKKVITYLLSDSFTEIAVIAISLLAGLPVPVLPAQILWVNLIEDSLPAMALAFDPAEDDVMRLPPPPRKSPLIDRSMKMLIGAIGFASVIFTLGIYLFFLAGGSGLPHTRTMVFAAIGVNSLFYAFSVRSLRRPIWQIRFWANKHLIGAVLAAFALLAAAIYLPPLQAILRTEPLDAREWIILAGFGILNIVVIETAKWILIKRRKTK